MKSLITCVQIIGYVLACRSYSFGCTLHHHIIIIVQTYLKTLNLWTACQMYVVECLSNIKHILLVIHHTIYGTVCFNLPISLVMIEKIYTLSYHHQIGSMNYYPLFRIRSWNNGMRCMSLYIIMRNFWRPSTARCLDTPRGKRWFISRQCAGSAFEALIYTIEIRGTLHITHFIWMMDGKSTMVCNSLQFTKFYNPQGPHLHHIHTQL